MSRLLFVFLLALLPAAAQSFPGHNLGVTFGSLNEAGGNQAKPFGSSPMLAFDYGYRFHRHSQADIGVDIGFADPSGTRRNVYIPRFGYRLIIPLMQDRVEASVGAGAGHGFIKPTIPGSEVWLVYGQAAANYAIDADRKYRAGFVLRWFRDPVGAPVQQWISVGGQFIWGFGR